ncbi:MAG TPA: 2-oxoglutarate dehydrogenase complex dihydrolipoyllysine-residue succinyltransferase [Gammaproteobacteria bacterium]|nr:2-oxoglutarate dehydrogenase complex dihydrolipoyllysine-residue succinyltransferase [Gammaproteobacteria bacterium]
MSIEIKVPELPESVADATIASWYKQVGDSIQADEVLLDLETDKVILEVPVVKSGIIREIRHQVGDTVTAGQVLAVLDDSADVSASAPAEKPQPQESTDKPRQENRAVPVGAMSPSVRKLIAENNIDATQIKGSGKNGRILKQDVEDYLKHRQENRGVEETPARPAAETAPAASSGERVQASTSTAAFTAAPVIDESQRLERRVPMTRLRARIAERLLQSQHEAAMLTTFNEVNMKPVMELRKKYREAFEKKFGVRLGLMSFFVQASVEALKRFPEVNASIDGNDIVYHGYYDIGVAVSGPNGLVVPILRDADIMSIADIEKGIIDFAERARDNRLAIEDITGGTFTISNGGVFGSMLSTPIINPPQSAILGMHNITERAMVVDGEIVALPVMYLALSYDHRLIDGKSAVQFLVTIKQLLEDPSRILLGV